MRESVLIERTYVCIFGPLRYLYIIFFMREIRFDIHSNSYNKEISKRNFYKPAKQLNYMYESLNHHWASVDSMVQALSFGEEVYAQCWVDNGFLAIHILGC